MRKRLCSATFAALIGAASVAFAAPNQIVWPSGTQTFEDMALGDDVTTITSWVVVDTSVTATDYTIVATDNVNGGASTGHAAGSTKWLRVTDIDGTAVQNRFYSAFVAAPSNPASYVWTFWVNLETAPPATGVGVTLPKLVIQHPVSGTPANLWGIEFDSAAASLSVLNAAGGTVASTPLYSIAGPTAVGSWVRIDLTVDFQANTVSAAANSGSPVSLPIAPAGTVDLTQFRFCYRGEGAGNVQRMLVDDVGFTATLPASGVDAWSIYQ